MERDAIETGGKTEDAANDGGEFKVGAQAVGVEVKAFFFQLAGKEGVVPRLQAEVGTLAFLCLLFHGLDVSTSDGKIGFEQLFEKAMDVFRLLCHSALESVRRKGVITQKQSNLLAQIHDFAYRLKVVAVIAVGAACGVGSVEFLAQCTVFTILHEGDVARCLQGEDPAFESFLLGGFCCGLELQFRQSGKSGAVGDVKREAVGFFQEALREEQHFLGEFGCQLSIGLLVLLGEGGTGATEAGERFFQQDFVFGCELVIGKFAHSLHSVEQRFVEHDGVAVGSEDGRKFVDKFVQGFARFCAEEIVHHRGGAAEQFSAACERHDGVFKGWCFGI